MSEQRLLKPKMPLKFQGYVDNITSPNGRYIFFEISFSIFGNICVGGTAYC